MHLHARFVVRVCTGFCGQRFGAGATVCHGALTTFYIGLYEGKVPTPNYDRAQCNSDKGCKWDEQIHISIPFELRMLARAGAKNGKVVVILGGGLHGQHPFEAERWWKSYLSPFVSLVEEEKLIAVWVSGNLRTSGSPGHRLPKEHWASQGNMLGAKFDAQIRDRLLPLHRWNYLDFRPFQQSLVEQCPPLQPLDGV